MNRKIPIFLIIIICFFCVIVTLFLWPRDIVKTNFDNYESAVLSGSIENEWLPIFLPKSAKNIKSISNLDDNSSLVIFDFGTEFYNFIEAQHAAPAKTASALGIRDDSDHFRDVDEIIYIPNISVDGKRYPGVLLINRTYRKALYIK